MPDAGSAGHGGGPPKRQRPFKKKKGFGEKRVGVDLVAPSGWRLSVFEEQALRENKPVAKGAMEFFFEFSFYRFVEKGHELGYRFRVLLRHFAGVGDDQRIDLDDRGVEVDECVIYSSDEYLR